MGTPLSTDQMISSAANYLVRLSDDEIRSHLPLMQQLVSRITEVITPPPKVPKPASETIIKIAHEKLELTLKFFQRDLAWIITRLITPRRDDRLTSALSLRTLRTSDSSLEAQFNNLEAHFLRLLACRHLALGQRGLEEEEGQVPSSKRLGKRNGKGLPFIRENNIPLTNQIKDGLKRGTKLLRNEDATGISEISLILLPALPKFDLLHADEAQELSDTLLLPTCKELMDGARQLAQFQLLDDYQFFYDTYTE